MSSNMLPTSYQEFIHKSKICSLVRRRGKKRELRETVSRYVDFMEEALLEKHNYKIKKGDKQAIDEYITNLSVMPSMRAIDDYGYALKRDNVCEFTTVVICQ